MKNVTTPTSIINRRSIPKRLVCNPEKSESVKELKSSTIAMFIKLFVTRIVAKSFFGFESKASRIANFFTFDFWPLVSKSDGVRENKATSAPEINAEHASKTISKTKLVIWATSKTARKNKPGGSVSKSIGFSRQAG